MRGSDGREVRSSESERKSHETDREVELEEVVGVEVVVVVEKTVAVEVAVRLAVGDVTGEEAAATGPTSSPPDTTGRSATVGDFGPSPGGGGIGEG